MPTSRRTSGIPGFDAAAVLGITVLSLVLAARFQLAEALYALTRRWETVQLDELPVGLLVLAIGLIWLSWRRNRQAGRELHARQRAESRLAGALEENRRLAQEHLRIQELERKHLARELHDELGQYLNAIKVDAVSISGSAGDAALSAEASRSIVRSVDHVHAVVSGIIRRLRPVGLDDLGLAAAIEHCIDHWRGRLPGTRFALRISGDFDTLDEALTLTLYRLIQEGLTNIYKHAQALQVDVVLQRRGAVPPGIGEVLLRVADDGRGMEAAARITGFGLAGMRERVELAGGSFVLESAPGRGLAFEVCLPVAGK